MQPDTELAAAIEAASSPDWSVRARAARQLARRAERPDIAEILLTLLLDAHDTAVTDATGHALLARGDIHGVRLIAQAVATADDEQLDHLYEALAQRHPQASGTDTDLKELCSELTHDLDPMTRTGAEQLITWISP